ncbi:hypothetical protein [Massilia pseudoviolaceinigra]|uniref:hypothetical protein n=1 Tax=Massilia pseudoviolaceinigra TaxID=3057165 RepID=UPI0027967040|nr:hypothetical protein [Massilia sp. CCM 9206]MDQ1924089.1 hypothetical protein [Massilia sp. CCM 9206]
MAIIAFFQMQTSSFLSISEHLIEKCLNMNSFLEEMNLATSGKQPDGMNDSEQFPVLP